MRMFGSSKSNTAGALTLSSFDRALSGVTVAICFLLITLMMLQISLDALLRNAFGRPFTGTVEIVSNYYMVGLSFLPIALAQRKGRQIEASFLFHVMPNWAQQASLLIGRLLGIALYGIMAWLSFLDAMAKTRIGAFAEAGTTSIPIWPCYWILPISFALMVVALALPPRFQDASLTTNVGE